MAKFGEAIVKEEIEPEHYVLVEDDIKVEETCLQSTDLVIPPASVIVERQLQICSLCHCVFERTKNIKLKNESDFYKCNTCILHSKLNQVFNGMKKKTQSQSKWKNNNRKNVFVESNRRESILVKKILYMCTCCGNQFERKGSIGLHEASDWYKCNKCILHSKLQKVFRAGM